jgi:hypothetical protein
MTSKLGKYRVPRISMESACLWSMRCPVYRWRESDLGSGTELGKSSSDAKENSIRGSPSKGDITDVLEDVRSSNSSVEASVMGVERRG